MNNLDTSVRLMATEDCAGVVDLIRSCYGDTYGVDYFYHVGALISKMESGHLRSVIALKNEKIVGHMALLRRHPHARVCEAGNTVIHRSARNEGLMKQLASQLHELALESGFIAYVHYPTTAHSIMQKISVDHGGVETGLMLRYIAGKSDYEQTTAQGARLAATVVYQPVSDAPPQELLRLPVKYAELISDLYSQLSLPRQIRSQPNLPLPADASLTSSFNQRSQCLQIDIEGAGVNLANELAALIGQHQPCVSFVDLPVDCNDVDMIVESLNKLGFFYAALLPSFASTDILRLQKLSHATEADIQPDLVNDTSRRLMEFIREDAFSVGALKPSH